jgi:hypothetical protein
VVLSYMMIYTVYTALENRKIAFNCVCADEDIAFFASAHLPRMANRAVTAKMLFQSVTARMIVRHYPRRSAHCDGDLLAATDGLTLLLLLKFCKFTLD